MEWGSVCDVEACFPAYTENEELFDEEVRGPVAGALWALF